MKPKKNRFKWKGFPVPSDRSLRILNKILESSPGDPIFEAAIEEARDPGDPFLQIMLWARVANCYIDSPRCRALFNVIGFQTLSQLRSVLEGKCYGVLTYADNDRTTIIPAVEGPDMENWFKPLS